MSYLWQMNTTMTSWCSQHLAWALSLLIAMALSLTVGIDLAHAEDGGRVQVLTGHIEPEGIIYYTIPDLKQGETLYASVNGTSGNLDPFLGLFNAGLDPSTLEEDFIAEVNRAIANGRDPLAAIPEIADDFLLIWDDDSGTGYAAALEFMVPADGDYQLLVASTPNKVTFGDYRLLIGLDAPEVLTGQAQPAPTGDSIAILNKAASRVDVAVQETTGTLTADKSSTFFTLNPMNAGDTLYVFIEATSGDLAPIIFLRDFGNKPLRSGNYLGEHTDATIQYTFDSDSSNVRLEVQSCCEGRPVTTGDFRLLVGVNAPEVLTGEAVSTGPPILRRPTEVQVGIRIQQITKVDQTAENFGIVASLVMQWTDPQLAFSPDTCQCNFKLFTADKFIQFLTENGIRWPEFTIFNQQGNRWTQNQLVAVFPDGQVIYFERFSTTLQAPGFDFRKFPFDTQQFFIRIDSILPEEFYLYTDPEGSSGVGEQLGEEEWQITKFDTNVSSEIGSMQEATSRFSFRFEAHRHLNFYIFRVFMPILLIIIVSWITFFLKDYSKRIDVTSANLLVFVAFNFTIAGELPRLGYLTFLDTILISAFIISVLVIVLNVYLKWLEVGGKGALARRIDQYVIWVYPLAYITAIVMVTAFFS